MLEEAKDFLGEPSAFHCDCDGAPRWINYDEYGRHQSHEPVRDAFGDFFLP